MTNEESSNMINALKNHLDNMTEAEKEEMKAFLKGPKIPLGWVSIEDHLPFCSAGDYCDKGYSEYKVKFADGTERLSGVCDHHIWYYEVKAIGVTHWYNERD
jgi:hypothetical protein